MKGTAKAFGIWLILESGTKGKLRLVLQGLDHVRQLGKDGTLLKRNWKSLESCKNLCFHSTGAVRAEAEGVSKALRGLI